MAALILLAGCLAGHAKLDGDLRPSDPEADGTVDQRHKLRLCLLLRNPGVLDPLQDLGGGHPGSLPRMAVRFRWPWPPALLCLLGSWARPALGLAHAFQHAGQVRQSGSPGLPSPATTRSLPLSALLQPL